VTFIRLRRIGLASIALIPLVAAAHSGGLDKCGGHNDKKKGGYHVHNAAKYCQCNPTAEQCKANRPSEPSKKN
jgi:hypothetical protein